MDGRPNRWNKAAFSNYPGEVNAACENAKVAQGGR